MRKLSQVINEHSYTGDKNPGNGIIGTGVTNHYTPIQNIITNVKNLFAVHLGVVVGLGEDNVSLKLHSSKFVDEQSINKVLYEPLFNDYKTLDSYIREQGLTKVTKVNLGMYYVVYYSPTDIVQATNPVAQEPNAVGASCDDCGCGCCPCPCEAKESLLDEFEVSYIIKEDEAEEELKDVTLEKIIELVDSKDKVKAAKQLEILVSQQIELPREYYFAAIKFKSGEEAIALRWKYTKKLPTGQSTENVRSLMHIFGKGDKAIWVQDFDKDSIVKLPEDVKKLIESILELLEADKTDDPAVFKLTGERKEREEKKDDKKEEDDKKDDNKKDDKKEDDDDSESDDDRGDDSDLL